MRPLAPYQTGLIASAVEDLRIAFNRFDIEPCEFSGTADDFSALDFIDYELPIAAGIAAGSLAFSMAWGHVLVTSFGFQWVPGEVSLGSYGFAVRHLDPSVLIFPYFRILEMVQSAGCHPQRNGSPLEHPRWLAPRIRCGSRC